MTKDNRTKKAIRARMSQTGEPYSLAANSLSTPTPSLLPSNWNELNNLLNGGFEVGKVYLIGCPAGDKRASTIFSYDIASGPDKFSRRDNLYFQAMLPETTEEDLQNYTRETRSQDLGDRIADRVFFLFDLKELNKTVERNLSKKPTAEKLPSSIVIHNFNRIVAKMDMTSFLFKSALDELRQQAINNNAAIFLFTEVSKVPHNTPQSYLISELEEQADGVIMLEPAKHIVGEAFIHVTKNHRGKLGKVELLWQGENGAFLSLDNISDIESDTITTLKAGDKVRFAGNKNRWEVRDVSTTHREVTHNFVILTRPRPFTKKEDNKLFYTIIDWEQSIRGAHNSWGYGATSQEDIEEMMEALIKGYELKSGEHVDTIEVSHRNRVDLEIDDMIRGKVKAQRIPESRAFEIQPSK